MGYIYKITNDINDKVYIGQTQNSIGVRWSMHKQHSKTLNTVLYRAMRKYGLEHFSIIEIEECDNDLLNEREIYWISYYDSYNNGYNMNPGGRNRNSPKSKYKDMILKTYNENSSLSYQQIANIVECSVSLVSSVLNANNKFSKYSQYKGLTVLQYDLEDNFIQEFESANAAAKSLNKSKGGHSPILKVCKNEPHYNTAYGYKWKFKE